MVHKVEDLQEALAEKQAELDSAQQVCREKLVALRLLLPTEAHQAELEKLSAQVVAADKRVKTLERELLRAQQARRPSPVPKDMELSEKALELAEALKEKVHFIVALGIPSPDWLRAHEHPRGAIALLGNFGKGDVPHITAFGGLLREYQAEVGYPVRENPSSIPEFVALWERTLEDFEELPEEERRDAVVVGRPAPVVAEAITD